MNGDHPEEITAINAVKGMYTRHVSNTENWAINMKTLIIFHRALQNHRVLAKCGKEISKRDQLIQPYKTKSTDYNPRMYQEITADYCNYIKFYIKLCLKIPILQVEKSKMKE